MGTIEKAGAGRAGSCKKIGEGAFSVVFFYQIRLVARTLFRSSPLTESLEQATNVDTLRLNHTRTNQVSNLVPRVSHLTSPWERGCQVIVLAAVYGCIFASSLDSIMYGR